jgi:hypothetical protein
VPEFDHAHCAATLAVAVQRLRESAEAGEPQKAALRALTALAAERSFTVRYYDGVLSVDEEPVSSGAPFVAALSQRLKTHSIAEIVVGRGAEPMELLALVTGLAAEHGQGRLKERLRDAASTRVMVILEPSYEVATGRKRPPSVTDAFNKAALDEAMRKEWDRFLSVGAQAPAPRTVDLGIQPPPEAAPAPTAKGEPAPLPVPTPLPSIELPVSADTPLGKSLADLLRDPYGRDLLARVTRFGKAVESALKEDRIADAVRALAVAIGLESGAPDPAQRGSYSVVIKRTLGREALAQMVPCLADPRLADDAVTVLRRGEEDAAQLLLGLLATAQSLGERMGYMRVLKGIPKGPDRVVQMLRSQQWQVARNVAEVVGEARIEEAATYLVALTRHTDQRVRRSALAALARIGTPPTVEPLRTALKEGPPELRALIASAVGRGSRGLVGLIASFAESESDVALLRDYYRALGRIGTPEAVRVLAGAAEAGGKLLKRKSGAVRLAAVEGLRLAGNPAAATLQSLASDGDRSVREAAQQALGAAPA